MDTNSLGEIQGSAEGLSTGESYTESSPSAPAEKTYPASKVQEMIRHANKNVADKVRKETYEQYQSELASQQPTTQTQRPSLDESGLRKIIGEEFQNHQQNLTHQQQKAWQEQEGNRLASEIISKINADKHNFPDFDSLMNEVPLATIPHIAQLAHGMDNTTAVLHEVLKNPLKAFMIEQCSRANIKAAEKELRKIADSIKLNEQAKNVKLPNEPLSQLKTSTAGVDSGSNTVNDWRKIMLARKR